MSSVLNLLSPAAAAISRASPPPQRTITYIIRRFETAVGWGESDAQRVPIDLATLPTALRQPLRPSRR